ncbi:MAG: (2Fe-2S) ferredoxin domain-containing protein [Planctomycetes bacterium]|jgi:(2Fe-2S) ferredoxin|nr:(2Fe-2S) ferredoxin domain-containing protein [Planctomycetota bacterium]MBT4029451.1 (2Fe-2S) ferredoxin domain-containing protein [Planctomycetota bacterium]MBT4559994.1 (2Fe-2S) ferredoxin domain-containing protein [Planctomycetota bacterium]MBT5100951.1 (2Fe-2S) ferredoxin domain-containing protein [Planctomycetota bacterium]MBT5120203.1 (2Fe-2S) ferredoxin domain-containing protein [Planctomycetota bacterium]
MNAQSQPSQYLFVCTRTRESSARESCGANHASGALVKAIRDEIKSRGLKAQIRATSSGCLGRCQDGPHALAHPSGESFSQFGLEDVSKIADSLQYGKSSN